ncbi:MAG: hypothetical protein COB50_01430 [Thiotrichales bacterium]|nr:MAG: hypothetical protein COB50_01430 [Thiotrichales bacterium]
MYDNYAVTYFDNLVSESESFTNNDCVSIHMVLEEVLGEGKFPLVSGRASGIIQDLLDNKQTLAFNNDITHADIRKFLHFLIWDTHKVTADLLEAELAKSDTTVTNKQRYEQQLRAIYLTAINDLKDNLGKITDLDKKLLRQTTNAKLVLRKKIEQKESLLQRLYEEKVSIPDMDRYKQIKIKQAVINLLLQHKLKELHDEKMEDLLDALNDDKTKFDGKSFKITIKSLSEDLQKKINNTIAKLKKLPFEQLLASENGHPSTVKSFLRGFALVVSCAVFAALTMYFGWFAISNHALLGFFAFCNGFIIGNVLNHGISSLAKKGLLQNFKGIHKSIGLGMAMATVVSTLSFAFVNWMILFGPTQAMLSSIFGVSATAVIPAAIVTLIPAVLFTAIFFSAFSHLTQTPKHVRSFKLSKIRFVSFTLALTMSVGMGLALMTAMSSLLAVTSLTALIAVPIAITAVLTAGLYKFLSRKMIRNISKQNNVADGNDILKKSDIYFLVSKGNIDDKDDAKENLVIDETIEHTQIISQYERVVKARQESRKSKKDLSSNTDGKTKLLEIDVKVKELELETAKSIFNKTMEDLFDLNGNKVNCVWGGWKLGFITKIGDTENKARAYVESIFTVFGIVIAGVFLWLRYKLAESKAGKLPFLNESLAGIIAADIGSMTMRAAFYIHHAHPMFGKLLGGKIVYPLLKFACQASLLLSPFVGVIAAIYGSAIVASLISIATVLTFTFSKKARNLYINTLESFKPLAKFAYQLALLLSPFGLLAIAAICGGATALAIVGAATILTLACSERVQNRYTKLYESFMQGLRKTSSLPLSLTIMALYGAWMILAVCNAIGLANVLPEHDGTSERVIAGFFLLIDTGKFTLDSAKLMVRSVKNEIAKLIKFLAVVTVIPAALYAATKQQTENMMGTTTHNTGTRLGMVTALTVVTIIGACLLPVIGTLAFSIYAAAVGAAAIASIQHAAQSNGKFSGFFKTLLSLIFPWFATMNAVKQSYVPVKTVEKTAKENEECKYHHSEKLNDFASKHNKFVDENDDVAKKPNKVIDASNQGNN